MALFQIMDNDSVAASVPRKATEEEKIGDNLQECQAVIMTDQKEAGQDSNQEDKGAEDTGKEGFGVNGESGLDDTEVCASGSNVGEKREEEREDKNSNETGVTGKSSGSNIGETEEEESFNETGVKGKSCLDRTNDTVRLNMQHLEAGTTSSDRSKQEQVVRFEGLEFIGNAGGSPSDSTTDNSGSPSGSTTDAGGSPTGSTTQPETSSTVEESIAKLKGLWFQCRNVFIVIIIPITLPENQPKDALL